MKKIILLLCMTFLLLGSARAKTDFITVDHLTYRLFTEQKWDSVIYVGKRAIRDDIDYYFLRLRMGISYFEKKEYIPSSGHLSKAIKFNSYDPVAFDYLYAAYVLSNRSDQARELLKRMPQASREKILEKVPLIQSIELEGGPVYSSDAGKKPRSGLMGNDSLYGEEDLYANSYYAHLGLAINLSSSLSLQVGYNFLNFDKVKNVQYGYIEDRLDSTVHYDWGYQNYYSFPGKTATRQMGYRVKQQEFHLGMNLVLPSGIRIQPAAHLIYDNYKIISPTLNIRTVNDTAWYTSADNTWNTFPFARTSYAYPRRDTSFVNYVFALTVTRDFSIFNAGLLGSYSNLNGSHQTQAGFSLSYFPLGSPSLYGKTVVFGLFQEQATHLIFQQDIGGKILKNLWLDANFVYGDLTNGNLGNGMIVYNNTGKINYRLGAIATWVLTEHLQLSLFYQYFEKESIQSYFVVPGDKQGEFKTKTNKFTTNSIIGGIKWIF